MRRTLLSIPLMVVLSLGAACGGDDDALAKDEQKAARSLAAEFQGNNPSATQRDSGVCLGKSLVRSAGVDKLVSSGMLTKDLSINDKLPEVVPEEIASAYADAVVDCQDTRAEIEERRTYYPKATDTVIDSYVSCMDAIDEGLLRKAVLESATRVKDGTASDAYLKATKPCTDLLGTPQNP